MSGHSESTWICTRHGSDREQTGVTYGGIAIVGVPVCTECGQVMEFQSEEWKEDPMDRRESQALDNHITGHYGEDQFKGAIENPDLFWKIGDIWYSPGQEKYILARMNDPIDRDNKFYIQFIGMRSGNRYSEHVIVKVKDGKDDCTTLTIEEVSTLLYGRDIANFTTDEDNVLLDNLENCHDYGPEWGE